jgi:hypothetical protein
MLTVMVRENPGFAGDRPDMKTDVPWTFGSGVRYVTDISEAEQ